MRAEKARLGIPFVLSMAVCTIAQAQTNPPDTQFTVGVKVWNASWLSYLPANYTGISASGTPAIGDSVNATEGKSHTDVFPQLSVRHKEFFASISHARFKNDFRVASNPIIISPGQTLITSRNDHFERRESDLNVGYYVLPGIALALGYKDATETRNISLGTAPQAVPLVKTTASGFLLGAIGNFTVYDKLRFYAQAGYGPARVKLRFADPSFGTDYKTTGRYLIGEIGLSYLVFPTRDGYGGATVSLGYRTQTIKTNSYASIFQETRKLRDVRDGAILAMSYTF